MPNKNYLEKDSITPDFLKSVKEDLRNLEETTENLSPEENEVSSARELENQFKFTGSGKSLSDKIKTAKKANGLNQLAKIKKQAPLLAIAGIIVAAIAFMFFSVGTLGNQIETLITRATDTMFGSYSENTLRITEELLDGKHGEFPEYLEERLQAQGITVASSGEKYTLDWGGIKINSGNFREVYTNDVNFREAYTKAKRGRSSNFYDKPATFVFTKLGVSRNLYRSYNQTGDNDADTKAYRKTETDLFDGGTSSRVNTVIEHEYTDDEGKTHTEKVKSGEDIGNSKGVDSRAQARSYLMNAAGRAADTANVACAALKVANMISISVAAAEIYQAINYFLSNVENISKTKAGDGNQAAEHQLLNFLNEEVTTTYTDVESGEEKEVTGAPIQAEGFANVLAGVSPNLNKTKNYSVESAFLASGFAIGLTAASNKACGGLRAVGAVASIAVGILSGGIVNSLASVAKTVIINAALQAGISATLSVLIPKIASALFENTAESLAGVPAGETFVKGAALGNKKVSRGSSGQLLATKEIAAAYSRQTQVANAYEAEINRKNASPFDVSNPDTFLGSIATKLAVINKSSSLLGSISSVASIAGNSFSYLFNSFGTKTFADSISDPGFEVDTELAGTDYSQVFADSATCEKLSDIGAACDMYGVEIPATDPKVMKVASDDPKYLEVLSRNVTKKSDGTYEVISDSLLAKKTMYCDERDSPFGVYDANIANAFQTSFGFADNIPILNDVIDLVNAVEDMSPETEGWALGSYCVMSEENPYYEDLIYLQHFDETARIGTQMELEEYRGEDGSIKNPILSYKTDYYEKNPIDTSEAGLLARYTGKTKEEAEEFIAFIDYMNYLAENTPPEEEKEAKVPTFKEEKLKNIFAYLLPEITYADLRTRSLVA
ncbi:hypothetical protein IJF91_03190 [Candidatus Saccharibacteria bacterium]|nr:hypothetical protein [Candidatus Saccharibacteria bacterium]